MSAPHAPWRVRVLRRCAPSHASSVICSAEALHDDELSWRGTTVTWSAGGTTQKQYTLPRESGAVIQACWCRFLRYDKSRCLCVLLADLLAIYEGGGLMHAVSLPFRARRLWTSSDGLLVERAPSAGAAAAPMIFSLLHPLEEVRPLAALSGGAEGSEATPMRGTPSAGARSPPAGRAPLTVQRADAATLDDDRVSIVFASSEAAAPAVLTYRSSSRALELWVLRCGKLEARAEDDAGEEEGAAGGGGGAATRRSLPEVFMERIWSEELAEQDVVAEDGPGIDAFISRDWRGTPIVCLLFHQTCTLRTLELCVRDVGDSAVHVSASSGFTLANVVAAAPIAAAGRPSLLDDQSVYDDLLVLKTSGTLEIFAGDSRLCDATVPELGQRDLDASIESFQPQIVGLKDTVANRVSFVCDDGSVHRVALDFSITSPAVRACLLALSACSGLPQELPFTLRTDTIRCSDMAEQVSDPEWAAFSRIILALVDKANVQKEQLGRTDSEKSNDPSTKRQRGGADVSDEVKLSLAEPAAPALASETGSDDEWRYLLSTNYHREHSMRSLFETITPGAGAPADAGAEAATKRAVTPTSPDMLACLSTASTDFALHLPFVVQVLHLAYEDFKSSILTSSEKFLRPIASFMHELAQRLKLNNFADHYLRDFGCLDRIGEPLASYCLAEEASLQRLAASQVPHLYAWLNGVCTGRQAAPAASLSIDGAPTRELHRGSSVSCGEELCQGTRIVCYLFRLLAGGTAERSFQIECYTGSPVVAEADGDLLPQMTSPTRTAAWHAHPRRAMESPSTAMDQLTVAQPWSEHVTMPILGDSPGLLPTRIHTFSSDVAHEKLVLGMVAVGCLGQELESLPFAIALPLREAIWSCRQDPPQGWPADAYVLIGREDLAWNSPDLDSKRSPMNTGSWSTHSKPRAGPDRNPIAKLERGAQSDEAAPTGADKTCDGTEIGTALPYLRFGKDQRLKEVQRLLNSSKPTLLKVVRKPETNDHDYQAQQQERLRQLGARTMSMAVGRGMFTLLTARPTISEPLPVPVLELSGRIPPTNAIKSLDTSDTVKTPPKLREWPQFHNGVAAGLRLPANQAHVSRTWVSFIKPDTLTHEHAGVLLALGLTRQLSLATSDLMSYLTHRHETTAVGVMLGMAASKRGSMDPTICKMLCSHVLSFQQPGGSLDLSSNIQSTAIMGIGLLFQGTANRFMTDVLLTEMGRRASDSNGIADDREGYSLAAGLALGFVTLAQGNKASGLSDLRIEDRLRRFMVGGKDPDAAREVAQDYVSRSASSRIKEGSVVNVDITAPGATLALGLMYLKTMNAVVAEQLKVPGTHYFLDGVRPDFILLRTMSRNLVLWDDIAPTEAWVQAQIPLFIRQAMLDIKAGTLQDDSIDVEAIRHAYWNIVAGACVSIGLRFASYGDNAAYELINKYLSQLDAQCKGNVSKRDHPTYESCFSMVVLGLSLVMAGTGNLATLRTLRRLRKRMDSDLNHGHFMATHMSIGLLFLGGGCCALGTSNEAIAALVASIFPHFPQDTLDNRYHLQAFRHLYVMAVESRCVEVRDVDTNQVEFMPLSFTLHDGDVIESVAPCLLPEASRVKSITISSPRYWPVTVDFEERKGLSLSQQCSIFVKRKIGYLPYSGDPAGIRSIIARPFPTNENGDIEETDFSRSFSADPKILAFVTHFGSLTNGTLGEVSYSAVLYECLAKDKPEMLPVYMSLDQIVRELPWAPSSFGTWMLKLTLSYYDSMHAPVGAPREPLLQQQYQARLKVAAGGFMDSLHLDAALKAYAQSGAIAQTSASRAVAVACFLSYCDIPAPAALRRAAAAVAAAPQLSPTVIVSQLLGPAVNGPTVQLLSDLRS